MGAKEELSIFRFDGFKVRTVGTLDAPLFCAQDVCAVLGLTNPSMVVASLDEDERSKHYLGRQGDGLMVTESGLYHLIFKSRKAAAKKFRRWVTDEVLPELRKKGFFSVIESKELITLPEWLEVQDVDLEQNKVEAKRLLKRAWEASKLLGYRDKRVDESSGLIVFPSQVLSLAADNGNAVESLPNCGESHDAIVSAIRGMVPDQNHSVDEMADLMGEKGTVQARRCRVGKLLNAYLGRELDGKTLVKVNEGRRNFFKLTSGDL